MASTPESKVKAGVVKVLAERGAYSFAPVTGGFGKSGVPDIIACYKGRFIGIECKAGKNEPTALQWKNINAIRLAKGNALVINETNLEQLVYVLDFIDGENK